MSRFGTGASFVLVMLASCAQGPVADRGGPASLSVVSPSYYSRTVPHPQRPTEASRPDAPRDERPDSDEIMRRLGDIEADLRAIRDRTESPQ